MTKPRKLERRGEKKGKERYVESNAIGEIKMMSNKVEQLQGEAVLWDCGAKKDERLGRVERQCESATE